MYSLLKLYIYLPENFFINMALKGIGKIKGLAEKIEGKIKKFKNYFKKLKIHLKNKKR